MSLGTRELNIASLMFIPGIETKNHEAYNTHEGLEAYNTHERHESYTHDDMRHTLHMGHEA
jgi:hypothetical protein